MAMIKIGKREFIYQPLKTRLQYKTKLVRYNSLVYFLFISLSKIENYFLRNRNCELLIIGVKNKKLVSHLNKCYKVHYLASFGEVKELIKYKIPFSIIHFNNKIHLDLNNKLQDRLLSKQVLNSKFLFIDSFTNPLVRHLIYLSKVNKCKVIVYQHGLLNKELNERISSEKYVRDYSIVWTNQDKEILENRGNRSVYVGGIPADFRKTGNFNKNNSIICFLGQPYEVYNETIYSNYLILLNKVVKKCNEMGFDVIYKAHPKENKLDDILNIFSDKTKIKDMSMKGALDRYDIFLSLYSTALIEVVFSKKIALQIINEDFNIVINEELVPAVKISELDSSYFINMALNFNGSGYLDKIKFIIDEIIKQELTDQNV
jgi:hypothetical protein